MTLQRVGAFASLGCAATYLFGFVFLLTVLAPLGFGGSQVDARAVVDFAVAQSGLLILWNSVIYIANALVLALLVVALADHLKPTTPGWAAVTRAIGIMWSTLVLGAGMIANVGVERAAQLGASDPEAAVRLWQVLHAVELGLGGGNEIAGAVWIGAVSLAANTGRSLGKIAVFLGLVTGLGGIATLIPSIGDAAGAVFGLGAIAWFIAVGISMLLRDKPAAP
ncbi:hypothetical protein ACMU_08505 [Actibacterium mucosum KCTC 23349]|uniref:DUF4386 domain-containing protein n=1 Tax=Actibacterium mucosum KCTC 23349 TaxID=1454373 RepID=A0A037ZLU9_9RHOB|nr:hypothetical protein [Actibacterium mucosum]KAJ55806.1 hypothetical protein ACMU_08505 [Actibacterium mucosum KCTC 23349]